MRSLTPSRIGAAAAIALCAGALVGWERAAPLRRRVEPGARRLLRNAAIGALTAAEVALVERPVVDRLVRSVERRRVGLVARVPLPPWARDALAILLLDYSLYAWHVLLHRSPALWRFHLAHHTDRDLDASTSLRFHVGEFVASVPWRAAQVAVIGASPRALSLWRALTVVEVAFHHANVRLPARLERLLAAIVVTPRLHGLHHSIDDDDRDRNFSSGLTLWDRLHRTFRYPDAVPQPVIGVPGYRESRQVTLGSTLLLPFR